MDLNRDLVLGALLLAVATISGIAGQHLFRRGLETRSSPPTPSATVVLTAEQEALLRAVDALQVEFAAGKLVLIRNGDVLADGATPRSTGMNLVTKVLRETPPPSEQPHARFVSLVESVPAQYLRVFHEARYGSPFVVSITEEGRRYLRR